jgi:hypothetical protein
MFCFYLSDHLNIHIELLGVEYIDIVERGRQYIGFQYNRRNQFVCSYTIKILIYSFSNACTVYCMGHISSFEKYDVR